MVKVAATPEALYVLPARGHVLVISRFHDPAACVAAQQTLLHLDALTVHRASVAHMTDGPTWNAAIMDEVMSLAARRIGWLSGMGAMAGGTWGAWSSAFRSVDDLFAGMILGLLGGLWGGAALLCLIGVARVATRPPQVQMLAFSQLLLLWTPVRWIAPLIAQLHAHGVEDISLRYTHPKRWISSADTGRGKDA